MLASESIDKAFVSLFRSYAQTSPYPCVMLGGGGVEPGGHSGSHRGSTPCHASARASALLILPVIKKEKKKKREKRKKKVKIIRLVETDISFTYNLINPKRRNKS